MTLYSMGGDSMIFRKRSAEPYLGSSPFDRAPSPERRKPYLRPDIALIPYRHDSPSSYAEIGLD